MDPTPSHRKFTMADLMILIAGTAVGIAWAIPWLRSWFSDWASIVQGTSWGYQLHSLIEAPAPALAPIGLALLVCRLRQPRPPLRRLMREPGTRALACAGLILVMQVVALLAGRGLGFAIDRAGLAPSANLNAPLGSAGPTVEMMLAYRLEYVGPAVAGGWISLLVAGRWKARPTSIDRIGRGLGIYWVAAHFLSQMTVYLHF